MRPNRWQEIAEVAFERAEARGELVAVAAFADGTSFAVFDSPQKAGGEVIQVPFGRELWEIAAADPDVIVSETERG
jgi:hypothetical protein